MTLLPKAARTPCSPRLLELLAPKISINSVLISLFTSTQKKSENLQHHHPNLPVFRQPAPACPLAGADQTRATIPLSPPRPARHPLPSPSSSSPSSLSRCTLCLAWAAAAAHLPPHVGAAFLPSVSLLHRHLLAGAPTTLPHSLLCAVTVSYSFPRIL